MPDFLRNMPANGPGTSFSGENTKLMLEQGFLALPKEPVVRGKTWTQPKVLSDDDPKNFGGQFFPNLSIAPNGRVDVVWWDTRDIQGLRGTDAYYTYSNDDGRTWSRNVRVTDQSVDRKLGIWGNNYDIASQPGVASTNAYAVTACSLATAAHPIRPGSSQVMRSVGIASSSRR